MGKIYSQKEIDYITNQANMNIFVAYVLADVQEALVVNAEQLINQVGNYRYSIKRDIEAMKKICERFRTGVKNNTNPTMEGMFADKCDEITLKVMEVLEKSFESL
jgi:hypothetical protein